MAQIHHFDLGWITPTVSYILSVLGSMLGLTCAIRIRTARSRGERAWWISLSSVAIGGTAIWSMHFVAMMGFKVVGTPIRYDVGLTVASAILAIAAVAVGMSIAALGSGARNTRILIGGVLAGLGVAGMHYTGMAAMRLNGDVGYDPVRVGLSIAIAVVAAAVALWLAVTVQRPLVVFASALVMGIAVNGMHFTGMSAMSVTEHEAFGSLSGATATAMIVPIGLAVVFGIIGLAYALMAAPTEEDRAAAAYLAARREGVAAPAAPAPEVPQQLRRQPSSGFTPSRPPSSAAPQGGPAQGGPAQGGPTLGQALGEALNGQPGQPTPGRPPSNLGSANWTYRDRERSGQ